MQSRILQTIRPKLMYFILIAVLVLVPQSMIACQSELDDAEISEAVKRELIYDPAILASNVVVDTEGGIVTLNGTTENLLAKDRTERIAETVRGVRSVVNLLEVAAGEDRTDEEIKAAVEEAWYRDPATDSYELTADVRSGLVEITGTVESWTERDLSETVAKGVKGVTEVNNQITVEPAMARNDLEIEREVEEALRWDVLVDHALVEVTVTGETVYLRGVVGSAAEKRRARRDALVTGVHAVDDSGLVVQRWARDEEFRGDKYVDASDQEIEEAVTASIRRHPRLRAADLTITADNGTVVLEGSVENLKAWRSAVELAHSTVGVEQVVNRLIVEPVDPPTDAEIVDHVHEALDENVFVEAEDIQVAAVGGVVTLAGSVESSFQWAHADDVAASVRGVKEVSNELEIIDDTPPLVYDPFVWRFDPRGFPGYLGEPYATELSDQIIKESVEQELFWSPFVDETDIVVTVDDGVVTLTGTVETLREQANAIENAYEGGATWVEENLVVVSLGGSP